MVFREAFGLEVNEVIALRRMAEASLASPNSKRALDVLLQGAPETVKAIRAALQAASLKAFSDAGHATWVSAFKYDEESISTLDRVLHLILADAVMVKDLAAWCLFHAVREASVDFQVGFCPAPAGEGELTGTLLGLTMSACGHWADRLAPQLARSGSSLRMQKISLEILGGEQESGGDFGIILDLSSRSAAAPERPLLANRIVPLLFQAKRYVRPDADISQRHAKNGLQFDLLRKSKGNGAYIFYENGKVHLDSLPPLVKPAANVSGPPKTSALAGSLDLATYLLLALYDEELATSAQSESDALKMIFSRATPGQLVHLAVISGDPNASTRYEAALAGLASSGQLRADSAPEDPP